jgi:hypothetical protein
MREKKGRIDTLYPTPPEKSAVICLEQMGPVAAQSEPGQPLVHTEPAVAPPSPGQRATQEIDYGRRGKGYIFGAFCPATGEALTKDDLGRTITNGVDFLGHVEQWVPTDNERLYAIVDNLNGHRATDVLLLCLHHPRGEFVFQPKYAAYLKLIEPWWKMLRSLALKGRRFESWEELVKAVAEATAYWHKHRHPYLWGRRRRHQPRRKSGIAALPKAA